MPWTPTTHAARVTTYGYLGAKGTRVPSGASSGRVSGLDCHVCHVTDTSSRTGGRTPSRSQGCKGMRFAKQMLSCKLFQAL